MSTVKESFEAPHRSPVVSKSGLLTNDWTWFIRRVWERLYALGNEKSFDIVNNQSSAANVTGLVFNKRGVSAAKVYYLIQRVTTGGGAIEKIESGLLFCTYNPTSEDWDISVINDNSPDNTGVTFSITSSGQVQYTSANEGGTASISKLYWRAETLSGKNILYSEVGRR